MGIERFVAGDEFVYSFRVGGESVEYHVSSIDELRIIAYMHSTERPVLEDLVDNVGAGDSVLDVGANLGIYSALAGATGATAIAVEPIQQNAVRARRNLELNCEDWEILPFSLGDRRKLTRMSTDRTDAADSTASIGDGRFTVPMLTGDEMISEHLDGVPEVVKIDVEGAEGLVIDGLEETLRSEQCRRVYVELHEGEIMGDRTVETIRSRLSEWGFSLSTVHERENDVDGYTREEFVVATR